MMTNSTGAGKRIGQSFRKLIIIIMKDHWLYIPQRSIIHLSPLFSSKKIDLARSHQRAFFCPGAARAAAPPESKSGAGV
ncbi:hypothetical protein [Rugamonas sp.]|uniref:hypothetical protein n=1 Tax=Rugamonas sp. TaxID=1926287 RepID=UPI0025EDE6FA|nr:hypothetical protein [Rugamonas sp.]